MGAMDAEWTREMALRTAAEKDVERVSTVTPFPDGVIVPPHLAALLEKLIGYGLAELASRNGHLPAIPELEDLCSRLHIAAISARGRAAGRLEPRTQPHYLTTRQAAAAMGISTRRVRQLAAAGRIVARKTDRDWTIDPSAVRNYTGRAA